MVHPSALSPPVFRSVDRNWDESEVPLSSSQPSAHICYGQKKNKQTKKTNQLKLVRVPIHYYMYRHRFSDLVEEVSFRPAGSHSRRIIRLVGFLPSLRASSPFGGSLQVHARATRERKHDSEGPPARAYSRGSFSSPKWRACSQANSCSVDLCLITLSYHCMKQIFKLRFCRLPKGLMH